MPSGGSALRASQATPGLRFAFHGRLALMEPSGSLRAYAGGMATSDYDFVDSPGWSPLLEAAWVARENAHAPYSGFKVGAALLFRDGRIESGCNVENAAYPLTVCAERNAIGAAVAKGMRDGDLVALAVVTEAPTLTPPCGGCRQVIAEFAERLPVLLANRRERALHDIADLLPHAFTGRNLHLGNQELFKG